MPLDPNNLVDHAAYKLLRHRQEAPPADLWGKITDELDDKTSRRWPVGMWWTTMLLLLVGAVGAAGYWIGTHSSAPATASDYASPPALTPAPALAEAPAFAASTGAANASEQPQEPVLSQTPPTSHLSPPTSHLSSPTSHLSHPTSHLSPPTSHLPPPTSHFSPPPSHLSPPPSHFSSPAEGVAVPQEFSLDEHLDLASSAAQLDKSDEAVVSATAPTNLEFLDLLELELFDGPNNRLRAYDCPAFSLRGDREVRMTFYAGPRLDRKVFGDVTPADDNYREARETLEDEKLGFELGLRAEVGRRAGPFVGFGLNYGNYASNFQILGPLRSETTTKEVRDENGTLIRIDTSTVILRDTTIVHNRHHTMAFFGTGGYRHQMKNVAIYVAADLGYEVVTESGGALNGRDGNTVYYALEDDGWINRTPGFTIGGRVGVDIELLRTPGDDPGRLGLLLEASARNTGVFSGSADDLSYRYGRVGFSGGLRYRF